MCNLYNLRVTRDELIGYFKAQGDRPSQIVVEKDYAAPGKPGYVVRQVEGRRVLDAMLWGFPSNKRERKTKPKPGQSLYLYDWYTNARNLSLGMWKPWLAQPERRCLVPFTRFAEPKSASDRSSPEDINWWFTVPEHPIAAFAGIWKVDPDNGPVYAFLTCEPNELVGPKHPKAMPVILSLENYDRWLNGSTGDAAALVCSYPADAMAIDAG